MSVTQNNIYVHSSPPKAISGSGAAIRQWVKTGDIEKLEKMVLDGQGARLLGLAESSQDPKVKGFLKSIPAYMAKVDLIHDAVIRGSLRETQALIDKKKLSTARDAVGRGVGHKAVIYNNKSILEWLAKKHPEILNLKDNEGRTSLHYAAASRDPDEMYDLLVGLGSNPELIDMHGRKPNYYISHPEELDIEGPTRSLSRGKRRRISPILHPKRKLIVSPPSITRAQIRIWIHEKDIPKLEKIVWSGHGDKLLLETTNNGKVRKFLENVPHLLSRIKSIHGAAINNDLEGLKGMRTKTELNEIFKAKDLHGLTPLHKAAGLGNRGIIEYLMYEIPDAITEVDNEGRTPLHYAARDPNVYAFLVKDGADENVPDQKGKTPAYYRSHPLELDTRHLRNVPDAPRVSGELSGWDRASPTLVTGKRRTSSGEFSNEVTTGKYELNNVELSEGDLQVEEIDFAPPIKSMSRNPSMEDKKSVSRNQSREEIMMVDQQSRSGASSKAASSRNLSRSSSRGAEGFVKPESRGMSRASSRGGEDSRTVSRNNSRSELDEKVKSGGRREEVETHFIQESPEESMTAEVFETRADVEELPAPPEEMLGETLEEQAPPPTQLEQDEEFEARPMSVRENELPPDGAESEAAEVELPPPMETAPQDEPMAMEEVLAETIAESVAAAVLEEVCETPSQDREVEPEVVAAEVFEEIQRVSSGLEKNEITEEIDDSSTGMTNADKNDANTEEDNGLDEVEAALKRGDMESLVNKILDGKGNELLNRTTENKDVQEFLANVPAYMAKISSIHGAAGSGNLRDLQSLLDRKRLAVARDALGRGPLHVAVLNNHATVARYMASAYPQSLRLLDTKGRSPLHFAATLPDSGVMFKFLVNLGADPNVKDLEGNTPGIYLRNRDLLTHKELMDEGGTIEVLKTPSPVQTWERPKTPSVSTLSTLETFYNTTLMKKESLWTKAWRRLTHQGESSCKELVRKYLDRNTFDLIKMRGMTDGASLLDVVKFYPQFFIIAPGEEAYDVYQELFVPAIVDHNHINGEFEGSTSLFGESLVPDFKIPPVDIPSKYVTQVRIRVSRNIRPFPFVPQMKKEDLVKVSNLLKTVQLNWPCFDLEALEKEVLEDLKQKCWMPEATKISRLWPKQRYFSLSHDGNVQVWMNAEDHLDIIVTSKYGKLFPMLELLNDVYMLFSQNFTFYENSQFGFLTVDPLRVGTGTKITFRIRLPTLMKEKEELAMLCSQHNLSIRWKQNRIEHEIEPDDWIELENLGSLGKSELELALDIANSINQLIKAEEEKARILILTEKENNKK